MILPDLPTRKGDPNRRHAVYRNLVRQCEASRETRRARNGALKTWFLTGTEGGQPARYNKLAEHVQADTSYLYAPASVRFGVHLPSKYGDTWVEELEGAREEMQRLWHDSHAWLTFGLGVAWAHVWDTALFKVYTEQN